MDVSVRWAISTLRVSPTIASAFDLFITTVVAATAMAAATMPLIAPIDFVGH